VNNHRKIRFNSFMDMAQENLKLAQENAKLKQELEDYKTAYKVLLIHHTKGGSI
jgi:hypothetical protein